ncbi:MAG TPA: hypothetical protein VLK58_21440 [Conexibacter sp.]|nr:hypothetical protein [Conexibacter sp.]
MRRARLACGAALTAALLNVAAVPAATAVPGISEQAAAEAAAGIFPGPRSASRVAAAPCVDAPLTTPAASGRAVLLVYDDGAALDLTRLTMAFTDAFTAVGCLFGRDPP